jgi:hypothetical protein
MACPTIGTAANNTLTGFVVGTNDTITADVATLSLGILDDQINTHPIFNGAYTQTGLLVIPNRGILKCLAGDYVAFDSTTGWPILISKRAAANAGWVHVP